MSPYLNGILFVDPWSKVVGVSPEGNLQQGEELVHSSEQSLRPEGSRVYIFIYKKFLPLLHIFSSITSYKSI